jgi:hypothetical protein
MKRTRKTKPRESSTPPAPFPNLGGSHHESKPNQNLGLEVIRSTLFFGFLYLFVWRSVELQLIYHGGGELRLFPTFFWGWDFLRDTLRNPGGLADYFAALLAQSFSLPWAGAMVVTIVSALISVFLNQLYQAMSRGRPTVIRFAPPLLILTLYAQYLHVLGLMLSLLVTLAFAYLYAQVPVSSCVWLRSLLLAAFALVVYGFTEGGLTIFLLWAVVFERLAMGHWRLLPAACLLAIALPYAIGTHVFDLTAAQSYRGLLPLSEKYEVLASSAQLMAYSLWLMLPVLATGLWCLEPIRRHLTGNAESYGFKRLFSRLLGPPSAPQQNHREPSPMASSAGKKSTTPKIGLSISREWAVTTVLLALATGIVIVLSPNRELKAVLEADYLAYHQEWSKLLEAAKTYPRHLAIQNAVNRALFHTGRFCSDLSLDQKPEALFSLSKDRRTFWKQIDLCMDLGAVNIALHYATEAANFYGDHPVLLERLAWANEAIGNTNTAQVYWNALARIPFCQPSRMEVQPASNGARWRISDAELERLRDSRIRNDRLLQVPLENLLLDLLDANPKNRMAFEYLMAYYLINKNLRAFAANLHRMKEFEWLETPRLFEEAGLVAAELNDLKIEIQNAHIRPSTLQRFTDFKQARRTFGNDAERAAQELKQTYGNSYFYHHLFD